MKITDDYVKRICRPTPEKCCAYLTLTTDGWECAKHLPSIRKMIDERLRKGTMRAIYDNCDGHGNKKIIN